MSAAVDGARSPSRRAALSKCATHGRCSASLTSCRARRVRPPRLRGAPRLPALSRQARAGRPARGSPLWGSAASRCWASRAWRSRTRRSTACTARSTRGRTRACSIRTTTRASAAGTRCTSRCARRATRSTSWRTATSWAWRTPRRRSNSWRRRSRYASPRTREFANRPRAGSFRSSARTTIASSRTRPRDFVARPLGGVAIGPPDPSRSRTERVPLGNNGARRSFSITRFFETARAYGTRASREFFLHRARKTLRRV